MTPPHTLRWTASLFGAAWIGLSPGCTADLPADPSYEAKATDAAGFVSLDADPADSLAAAVDGGAVDAAAEVIDASGFDDLVALSDGFDNPSTLGEWGHVFRVAAEDPLMQLGQLTPGWLTLTPASAEPAGNHYGAFAFKEVRGDFVVTTHVQLDGGRGHGAAPAQAGLVVRPGRETRDGWEPRTSSYIFGTLQEAHSGRFDAQRTGSAGHRMELAPAPGSAYVRVARIGDAFLVLSRVGDGPWTVDGRFVRPDVGDVAQVGPALYTSWDQQAASIRTRYGGEAVEPPAAHFEFVRFQRPELPDRLLGMDLSDPTRVPDNTLVAFLGAD